ncbi:hypothetical protein C8034_v004179 [Colletotrichum sidae]|uniref:Heterokaryon incompatibility domain-containing protein n=1 Tax=Colletotrichum sidae TaxID=1347389 RepID=A0A4R8TN70_9PEZI|nr:hypothetical protein C8034_v004179 [Colletotrichum sidae]
MNEQTRTICDFCRKHILKSKKSWDYYDPDRAKFEKGVESSCVFCKKLATIIEKIQPGCEHDISEYERAASYRWNMREAPRIRETNSHVSITFRPVPSQCRQCGTDGREQPSEVLFYLFQEEDLGYIPPDETSLGPATDSEESVERMKMWLDHCRNNHPQCEPRHTSSDFVPTRLLDVGPPGDSLPTHIRVVETKKKHIKEQYMTLSHCWGGNSFVQLTRKTFADFTTTGIPWKNDPPGNDISSNKNFVEAIRVAQRLGVRYLWIDSICIIQQDAAEWKTEAGLMHKVYRNSYCNLAAAASSDFTGGLFRKRSHDILPVQYDLKDDESSSMFGGRVWRILPADLWDRDLLGSPLYGRGWVFQERMLSPRLLQFGHDQIFWDCATTSACEALPAGLPPPLDAQASTDRGWRRRLQEADITVPSRIKDANGSLEKFWEGAVLNYTSCELTKHDDKDKAMWGIAKLVRDMQREEYAYGLWSGGLEEQLAWRVAGQPAKEPAKPDKEFFPSWSWTSLNVPIRIVPRLRGADRFYAAKNHQQEAMCFELETRLFRGGGIERAAQNTDTELGAMAQTQHVEASRAAAQERPRVPNLDEPSELSCEAIAVLAHVCRGRLQQKPQEGDWSVAVEGLKPTATIDAYLDVQPDETDTPCQFLVLAASRVFRDKQGELVEDSSDVDEDVVDQVQFSGVGILVEWVNEEAKHLKRVGSVAFRRLDLDDWARFRRACGEDDEALEYELDVENGQCVWLL